MKSFPETLNRLMASRNLSVKQLAEEVGIPRSSLAEWLAGRKPRVSNDLIELARYFGVSLEYMFTGKDPEKVMLEKAMSSLPPQFVQMWQGEYRVTIERKSFNSTRKREDEKCKANDGSGDRE